MTRSRKYLIAAVVLAVATAGCSGRAAGRAESTTTTLIRAALTSTNAASVTPVQLNAHLGVGVPPGWVPVDEGKARVFVPNGWVLLDSGACIGDPSAPGMIGVGNRPNSRCDHSQFPTTALAAALIPSTRTPEGAPTLTVHGYNVYAVAPRVPGWAFFAVPQLGVQIATHGSTGGRILATLAPSARTIALDPTYQHVPGDWRAVSNDGVTLSIPAAWSVETPDFLCGPPVGNSELLLIKPHVLFPPCPFFIPTAADAAHDAVALFLTPHNRNAPDRTGRPVTTLQSGTTTISVYAEAGDPNAFDLFVREAGSKITHVLTLGLGRDGRIAGAVVASIRATT